MYVKITADVPERIFSKSTNIVSLHCEHSERSEDILFNVILIKSGYQAFVFLVRTVNCTNPVTLLS